MLCVLRRLPHRLVYFILSCVNIETGGAAEAPGKSKYPKHIPRNLHLTSAIKVAASEDDLRYQRLCSIMVMNPETGKYELPPPRWFNKDTGEYENIKPMYFLDSNNPSLGIVPPSKVIREDDAFRKFLEDKDQKRLLRIERELREAEQARLQTHNPSSPPTGKPPRRKSKTVVDGFDEELVQKYFREATGRMISKRGATKVTGPSSAKEEERKEELEQRYRVLKPFATEDAAIKKLPPVINEDEIIKAWKNTPALCSVQKKARPQRTERERVRALIRHKSGKREWTLAAMRGSYRLSDPSRQTTTSNFWPEGAAITDKNTSEKKPYPWGRELQNHVWWENNASQSWSSHTTMREETGRLAINPVTGKLEDVSRLRSKTAVIENHVEELTGKPPLTIEI
jgi:hypothetical protein